MFRRLIFLLIPVLFLSVAGFSKKDIAVTAESAVIMEPWTRMTPYSKAPHKKLAPASTSKIMTALVVLKNSGLNNKVTVSRFASSVEPSKIYIKEGEIYSTGDLVKAVLLNSGNDASIALAESVAGSEEEFAKMMNNLAKALGARNTDFKNSNGLPAKGQHSTAYDLALMVRSAMRNKNFVDIVKIKETNIRELNTRRLIRLRNHNKSLWKEKSYSIYGKTGYTRSAGHCFAGYIEYNRWRRVIVVIIKSRKLWSDLERLAEAFR